MRRAHVPRTTLEPLQNGLALNSSITRCKRGRQVALPQRPFRIGFYQWGFQCTLAANAWLGSAPGIVATCMYPPPPRLSSVAYLLRYINADIYDSDVHMYLA